MAGARNEKWNWRATDGHLWGGVVQLIKIIYKGNEKFSIQELGHRVQHKSRSKFFIGWWVTRAQLASPLFFLLLLPDSCRYPEVSRTLWLVRSYRAVSLWQSETILTTAETANPVDTERSSWNLRREYANEWHYFIKQKRKPRRPSENWAERKIIVRSWRRKWELSIPRKSN